MTKGAILAAKIDERWKSGVMPPQHVLDEEADRKFTGGFDTSKSNLCPSCFCFKPVNGECC